MTPYIVVSRGQSRNTPNNTFKSSTKPTTRLITCFWLAFGVCATLTVLLYLYSLAKNDYPRPPPRKASPGLNVFKLGKLYQKLLQNKLQRKKEKVDKLERDFMHQWCRQRKLRVNWEQVIRPCSDNMAWGQVKSGWEKSQRTNASMSSIRYLDIRPAREFSRVFIQSRTKDGQDKRIGGDSWRVYLRGPSSIAATVFDHNNGTYEALFLIMEPGTYRLELILDFSLCDGYRDPPIDWFIKGILELRSIRNLARDPL